MGFLSKLFGSKPELVPVDFESTAEMVGEDKYWQIVQDSIDESGGDRECQENVLIRDIENLSPKEMIGFRLRTDKFLHDTYTSDMWCAGYVMNGGCSDDMFEYFRLWVISQGRDVYEKAKAHPDSLVDIADDQMGQDYDFESFWYVALTAFKNTTGKDLYQHIDYDNFKFGEGNYPQFDFTWTEEDDESRKKICPKLFERFEGQ